MPANGINGNATDEFPPNAMTAAVSKWTSCVPVNTSVYGEKKLDCSDEEWNLRVDLAAAYRQCYRQGLCEGINNHLTVLIPGTDHFLVFPFGLLWAEVTASSLLVVDSEGNVLRGKGAPESTAFYIHSRLHMRHPKGLAVMHTHQSYAAAICALEDPSILMVNQNSLRFYDDYVSHPYAGLVLDNTEGDQLADVMGEKRVLMHQSHGVIVCAETVAACFDILYYLERAAKVQVLAMSTGRPIHIIADSIAKQFKATLESGVGNEYARLHLEALKRDMLASEADKDFIT